MRQILFSIPLPEWLQKLQPWDVPYTEIPLYGYGLMLFFAFMACNFLARRLCRREGINPDLMLDMIIWLFVTGIIGARIVYVIQYWHTFAGGYGRIFALWDGGLVVYGSLFGGTLGYFVYHYLFLREHNVSHWKMMDVVGPTIAIGLAVGRLGCLCTGCCFGNVATCEHGCPSLHFPAASPAALEMVRRGVQTPLGFILKKDHRRDGSEEETLEVEFIEPESAAADAGLQTGDVIVKINEYVILRPEQVWLLTGTMTMTVRRDNKEIELPPFTPTSVGLHPTQIYETISMSLLLFFLVSYHRYKRYDGELLVFFMFGYGVHRFLNEMLRTDTDPVWGTGLTLSQNISLLVLLGGGVVGYLVWRRPPIAESAVTEPASTISS